jgi:HTH-type transcriptional regulator, transcriptional repressor of NAD biosynthesis genes
MTTGLIIGKFLPPHSGHAFLIETARRQVDHLVVLVCSLEREPIAGERRVAWLREMFPAVVVCHCADENPSWPHEDERFWEIWTASIRRHVPSGPDLVFSSEDYGEELARRLGARHVLVDKERRACPVRGAAVREDPVGHWAFVPDCVRPALVRRVVVAGPESTGKTTLACELAGRFATAWVPEFARGYLDRKYGGAALSPPCCEEDIPEIARGQLAAEDEAARRSNGVVVCDTDLYATWFYAEAYFGECPAWIREAARSRVYQLHLLLDADVPWVEDAQRDLPHRRAEMLTWLMARLAEDGRRQQLVSGAWEERLTRASAAVEQVVAGMSR